MQANTRDGQDNFNRIYGALRDRGASGVASLPPSELPSPLTSQFSSRSRSRAGSRTGARSPVPGPSSRTLTNANFRASTLQPRASTLQPRASTLQPRAGYVDSLSQSINDNNARVLHMADQYAEDLDPLYQDNRRF